jgi:hypothetical protein
MRDNVPFLDPAPGDLSTSTVLHPKRVMPALDGKHLYDWRTPLTPFTALARIIAQTPNNPLD